MKPTTWTLTLAAAGALTLASLGLAAAQHGRGMHAAPAPAAKPPAPISMEELHRQGGVPRGWKFTLPAGDPKTGRDVFAKLECNKCHEVKPDFQKTGGADNAGPELTGMGGHHPAEYFAQSIVDPNAVILAGSGYTGSDGRSIMPDYRDSLTVAELADLVAYLKSLSEDGDGHHHHHEANAPQETTAGPYKVRMEYREPGTGHAHGEAGHTHGAGGKPAKPTGHLMVFVADTATGAAVPYLPVSAAIRSVETAPRTVRLSPMIGDAGFHYGADVTLPDDTVKVTLTIGAAALKAMGAESGRFARPVTVSFDWE